MLAVFAHRLSEEPQTEAAAELPGVVHSAWGRSAAWGCLQDWRSGPDVQDGGWIFSCLALVQC